MDKRLFEESVLCANLPDTVLVEIEKIDPKIPTELFDSIFDSNVMSSFLDSVRLPEVVKAERDSKLLKDVKSRLGKTQLPKSREPVPDSK